MLEDPADRIDREDASQHTMAAAAFGTGAALSRRGSGAALGWQTAAQLL